MRTKILLTAVAAMAAGVVASNAQVVSANIVGYANAQGNAGSPTTSIFTLLANPLDNNGTNDMVSIVGSALPNKAQAEGWDVPSQTFIIATKTAGTWNTNFNVPPGTGFFVSIPKNSPTVTNTFVGNVINANFVASGGVSSNYIPATTAVLLGSPIPFSGALTDAGTNTINLGSTLPTKSQVSTWDVPSQTFIIATKTSGTWNTNLNIGIAQGFFVNSKSNVVWNQYLQ
jgi:hypothetical protein